MDLVKVVENPCRTNDIINYFYRTAAMVHILVVVAKVPCSSIFNVHQGLNSMNIITFFSRCWWKWRTLSQRLSKNKPGHTSRPTWATARAREKSRFGGLACASWGAVEWSCLVQTQKQVAQKWKERMEEQEAIVREQRKKLADMLKSSNVTQEYDVSDSYPDKRMCAPSCLFKSSPLMPHHSDAIFVYCTCCHLFM